MERSEVLKYVGKPINVQYTDTNNQNYRYDGYILIHENLDRWSTYYGFFKDNPSVDKELESYIYFLGTRANLSMSYISALEEIDPNINEFLGMTIYDCFGKEIDGWISKPTAGIILDLNHYPDVCPKCGKPSYNGSLFGNIDCSDKNCKGI